MQEGCGFICEGQEDLAGRMLLKTRENGAKQGNQHAHKELQQLMYSFPREMSAYIFILNFLFL